MNRICKLNFEKYEVGTLVVFFSDSLISLLNFPIHRYNNNTNNSNMSIPCLHWSFRKLLQKNVANTFTNGQRDGLLPCLMRVCVFVCLRARERERERQRRREWDSVGEREREREYLCKICGHTKSTIYVYDNELKNILMAVVD